MSNPQESTVTVRKAELKDMSEVYQMLKELTDFEQLPQNLKIDEAAFKKDYVENAFYCIVAEHPDGNLVGYSVYCQTYSTWDGKMLHLRDIYVRPEQRSKGIGKRLFLTALKNGYYLGCKLAFLCVLDWNPAVKFYKQMGAIDATEKEKYHIFRIDPENFGKLFN